MLASWKKSYDQPRQHIKKQRHYFNNKGPSSQNYGFSSSHVWMWELDDKGSWVPKNWCFWTVVLEKTLESPLDSRRLNQSILKEISPEYSLEGLMLKLKLQYFGHLKRRTDSLEKILMLGKIEGRRRGRQTLRWCHHWASSRSWWWTGKPGVLQSKGSQRVIHDWVTELNWTERPFPPVSLEHSASFSAAAASQADSKCWCCSSVTGKCSWQVPICSQHLSSVQSLSHVWLFVTLWTAA